MRAAVLGLAGFLVLGACASQSVDDAKTEVRNQDVVIKELRSRNEDLLAQNKLLDTELAASRAEVARLKADRSASQMMGDVAERLKMLEAELGKSGDMQFKARGDGIAVEVAETMLFESGKSTLKPAGIKLLKELGAKLAEMPGDIRVEGHTDNQPVKIHAKEYPLGNLQLSGARGLAVADALIKHCGLESGRVSFAGYGEYRPVAENGTREGQSRNRRVEIVILKPVAGK
jgi:chemotaxis protein MotB